MASNTMAEFKFWLEEINSKVNTFYKNKYGVNRQHELTT